jgi:FkbM family methyltransferase
MKSFDVFLDKANLVVYLNQNLDTTEKYTFAVSDLFVDCVYFIWSQNTAPKDKLWVQPLSNKINAFTKNNKDFAGFVVKIYNKDMRLIQVEKLIVNKNAKRFAATFDSGQFDATGPSYADFFFGDLCKNIDVSGTVVDAGANVGFFTLYAKYYGAKRIYSIDPDPLPFFYLEKNFGQDPNIILLNKGMNVSDDGMDINISFEASVGTGEFLSATNSMKLHIPTISIDSILKIENNINLLKLDIEGTEFKVIENLNKKHFDKINQFFIEFHFDPKPIAKKLIENGYKVEYRDSNESSTVGFIYATK